MRLHLGEETVVNDRDIIGIFDIENTSISKDTKAFLAASQKKERVVNVSAEMPKSFIVCAFCKERQGEKIYISQIAPSTLKKRAEADERRQTIDSRCK